MRETSPGGRHRRRFVAPYPTPAFDWATRLTGAEPVAARGAGPKGPDGIRHELVARIRQQIADGTYDTEEKWLLAEEALLRRVEGCV